MKLKIQNGMMNKKLILKNGGKMLIKILIINKYLEIF